MVYFKLMKGKRGSDLLHGTLVFLILNIIFFAALFFFIARAGSGIALYEQSYAKQLALLIDSAKKGSAIRVNLTKLYEEARENKFDGQIVFFDYDENKVVVALERGGGYEFNYFTKLKKGAVSGDGRSYIKININ